VPVTWHGQSYVVQILLAVDWALLSTAMGDGKEMMRATERRDLVHVDSSHVAHCQMAATAVAARTFFTAFQQMVILPQIFFCTDIIFELIYL